MRFLWLYLLSVDHLLVHIPESLCFTYGGYREHLLLSDQLCPNPVRNPRQPRNMTELIPKEAKIKPQPQYSSYCMLLLEDGSAGLIRAVSSTAVPWNYDGAQKCDAMIQFILEGYLQQAPSDPKMWCHINRWKHNIYGGKYFDPQLWLHPKDLIGIYFSTVGWDSTFNLEDIHPTTGARPKFLQFGFNIIHLSGRCTFVVQQYVINHQRLECRPWDIIYQNCGIYNCSGDQKKVLNRMGFSYIHVENETDSDNSTTDVFLDNFSRNVEILDPISLEKRHFDSFLFIAELLALVIASVVALNICLFSIFRSRKLSGSARRRSRSGSNLPPYDSGSATQDESHF